MQFLLIRYQLQTALNSDTVTHFPTALASLVCAKFCTLLLMLGALWRLPPRPFARLMFNQRVRLLRHRPPYMDM